MVTENPLTRTVTTTTLDFETTRDLLFKAVADRGYGYVAEQYREPGQMTSCAYTDPATGEPSCIVGWVLAEAGFPMDVFVGQHCNRTSFTSLRRFLPPTVAIDLDRDAEALLQTVQSQQDGKVCWGEAVIKAVQEVTRKREQRQRDEAQKDVQAMAKAEAKITLPNQTFDHLIANPALIGAPKSVLNPW